MNIMRKLIIICVLSALILGMAGMLQIYGGVKDSCLKAQDKYHENCTDSLMLFVQSEEESFTDRNTAIWALGQLADRKALPVLKSMYTGNIPNKEPYDKGISQYELKKAIKWCETGNATSWMYKNRNVW